ncbi:MAG TPA: acetylornithine deacetylase [Microscillaceae bacterium]|jgi:acetylornithine deacetylase|nr:acetylornithine deacetylase [Microscillaceae bacterium]
MVDALLALLRSLIRTPSFSREEGQTAQILADFVQAQGYTPHRLHHNVWITSRHFAPERPTLLLNSHHDTVKPVASWQRDPFAADIVDDKLYGLGSNDAGASLVGLLGAFLATEQAAAPLPFNLVWLASAEEEISGKNGIEAVLPQLGNIAAAIVGEPTQMQMAIAEKGLMVLDGEVLGKAGHAARYEGDNAIAKALPDVQWLSEYRFPQASPLLGEVKMSVTQIQAGSQHNVVPDRCTFVVDVRSNECYTNAELLAIIRQHLQAAQVTPRSLRLNASHIPLAHPLVQRGLSLGLPYYGSPTLSDQALMPFHSLKIGIGDSARSHTADEYVHLSEFQRGIALYQNLLQGWCF